MRIILGHPRLQKELDLYRLQNWRKIVRPKEFKSLNCSNQNILPIQWIFVGVPAVRGLKFSMAKILALDGRFFSNFVGGKNLTPFSALNDLK